ncbi:MAG: hypothetical protein AAF485_29045 [Chloroflexota bacterium]
MLILDLRWLILVGVFILIGLPLITVWLYQWRHRAHYNILPANQTLIEIFDQAPFGYLVLRQETGHYQFANRYACSLLTLPHHQGQLPTEEWTQVLLDDCETARQSLEQTGK